METLEQNKLQEKISKSRMTGGIFLTIKHLMALKGTNNYNSAQREHQQIRDALAKEQKKKLKLTVKEYCDYIGISEQEVRTSLREKGFTDI